MSFKQKCFKELEKNSELTIKQLIVLTGCKRSVASDYRREFLGISSCGKKLDKNYKEECTNLLDQNSELTAKDLATQTGCAERTAQQVKKLYMKQNNIQPKKLPKTIHNKYIHKKNYYYDEHDKVYVLHLKSSGKKDPFVFSESTVQDMRRQYSNWDGQECSMNEICRIFKLNRKCFKEIKTIFGWTHDSDPFTDEEISRKNDEELLEDLDAMRRNTLWTKNNHKKWEQTKKDAEKWQEFEMGTLNPFNTITAIPIKYNPKLFKKAKNVSKENADKTLVVTIADAHCGAGIDSGHLLYDNKYSIDIFKERMKYIPEFLLAKYGKAPFKNVQLLDAGEAHHLNTNSRTDSGKVQLNTSYAHEDIWNATTTSYADLIYNLARLSNNKLVKNSVCGNHASYIDYCLETYLKATFSEYGKEDEGKIIINPNRKLAESVVVEENSMLTVVHGKGIGTVSSTFNAKKELSANVIMQSFREQYRTTKHKYLFSAHLHHKYSASNQAMLDASPHNTSAELQTFEFFSLPSIVGTDEYADSLYLKTRPAICYFIFDDKGLESQHHIYFD